MKKIILPMMLLVLLLMGCTEKGTLVIESDSIENVWYELNDGNTTFLFPGETDEYDWDLASGISGEDTKEVTVDFGGDYWFFYDYTTDITIKPGETETVTIIGDAGEIEIWNDSDIFVIMEAYISPSSDTNWGNDDLGLDTIGPGESVIWKVEVGNWDILLVDDWDDEFTSMNNYIAPEERTVFYYDGFKKTRDAVGEKITNAKKQTKITNDIIERRN